MASDLSVIDKFVVLRKTIVNWPLVLLDKLGIVRRCDYRTRSGMRLICRAKSTDINEAVVVLSGLEYPPEHIRLNDGQIVLDLGANIGSFVLFFDRVNRGVKYKGFAFEPFKENFSLLKTNAERNGVIKFELIESAISDVDGTVTIDTSVSPDAISIKEGKGERVMSSTLSSFCMQHDIRYIELIKMDIEGAEYAIFDADYDFIKYHVRRLILEYHILDESRNLQWIASKTAADFELIKVHESATNGIVVLTNKHDNR